MRCLIQGLGLKKGGGELRESEKSWIKEQMMSKKKDGDDEVKVLKKEQMNKREKQWNGGKR